MVPLYGFLGMLAVAAIVLLPLPTTAARPTGCDACADDRAEYCSLFPDAPLCATRCGFEFDQASRRCREVGTTTTPAGASTGTAPIIGGSGKFRYQYMPELLQPPPGAALVNCHGLSVDRDENIILTYQNDGKDQNCLIKWNPDGTNGTFASKDTPELCSGTPHGLKITTEGDTQYLWVILLLLLPTACHVLLSAHS